MAARPSFWGTTAELYTRYRRDLPPQQATELVSLAGLRPDDLLVDLGAGTGQLAVPLSQHCAFVIALDPEPAMLVGLRRRGVDRVMCVLDDDRGLVRLGRPLRGPVGAVVIGNALHWMDEAATLAAAAALVRPGGAVCVLTQGPPMWLGGAPWQVDVRRVLEQQLGSTFGNCRTDPAALAERAVMARALGLRVDIVEWAADYSVDADWVLGHLGSAMDADQLSAVRAPLEEALGAYSDMVEHVTTTALVARRV